MILTFIMQEWNVCVDDIRSNMTYGDQMKKKRIDFIMCIDLHNWYGHSMLVSSYFFVFLLLWIS